MPTTIQGMPTVRASGCSATTAIHAANVPIPPITAVIGIGRPRMRTFHGIR